MASERFVIVGGGVAGTRAAQALRARAGDAAVTVVSDEGDGFYRRPQIGEVAAGLVDAARVGARTAPWFAEQDINLVAGRAHALDPDARLLSVETAELTYDLRYDRLLIASGNLPEVGAGPGNVPGADLEGVITLSRLADARRVAALQPSEEEAPRAVVTGSGVAAGDLAFALSRRGYAVTLLLPQGRLWPRALDEVAGGLLNDWLRAYAIEVVPDTIAEILGAGGAVRHILTGTGELLDCSVVGLAERPRRTLAPLLDGEPLVDATLRSAWDDVYVAGDLAIIRQGEREDQGRGWARAWQQGHAAGLAMAGEAVAVPLVEIESYSIIGKPVAFVGKTTDCDGTTGDFPQAGVYKKLCHKNGVIVGGIFVGDVEELGRVREAVEGRQRLDASADLMRTMFDLRYWRERQLTTVCPLCKRSVNLPPGAKQGDVITCPICGADLRLERRGEALVSVLA